jgi:CRISPR-associated endoribonuclease Cas6
MLKWVDAVSPETAAELHDSGAPKPYAISPLIMESGDRLYFDVFVLAEWMAPLLTAGAQQSGRNVRLGRDAYLLTEAGGVIRSDTWQSLAGSPILGRWPIRLTSPTASHAGSELRKVIVLPTPENYFGSWFGRWNLCSPIPLQEHLLDIVRERAVVSYCEGKTERVTIDANRQFLGFMGEVTFEILKPRDIDPEDLRALSALVRYASYCGTGVETVRGMGQTYSL